MPFLSIVSQEIPGHQWILALSALLICTAIGVIVASVVVLVYSYNYYIGAIYAGIISLLVGFDGFNLQSRYTVQIFLVLTTIGFIVSIIGVVIGLGNYNFVASITACATTTDSYSESCGINSLYHCYGESSSYIAAAACEISYDASYDLDTHCSCVTTNNGGECYNYQKFADCNHLTSGTLQNQLLAAYILSASCSLLCLILAVFCLVSLYRPSWVSRTKTRWEEEIDHPTTINPVIVDQAMSTIATGTIVPADTVRPAAVVVMTSPET